MYPEDIMATRYVISHKIHYLPQVKYNFFLFKETIGLLGGYEIVIQNHCSARKIFLIKIYMLV